MEPKVIFEMYINANNELKELKVLKVKFIGKVAYLSLRLITLNCH